MAKKVYKNGYNVIVDDELTSTIKYTQSTFCSFGFDGDNCWIKDLADTDEYIFNDDVDQMKDSAGTLIGNVADVETYLLSFIGDPSPTPSPII